MYAALVSAHVNPAEVGAPVEVDVGSDDVVGDADVDPAEFGTPVGSDEGVDVNPAVGTPVGSDDGVCVFCLVKAVS